MGKNMQISSQRSISVSIRPKNEKKIIAISFFVREICLFENRRALSRQFGQLYLAQFSQKLFSLWRSDGIGCKTYILIFVTLINLPPNNEQFLR